MLSDYVAAVQLAARKYITRGWRVVPIEAGTKACLIEGWPNLRLAETDVEEHFASGAGIGVPLGTPSGDSAITIERLALTEADTLSGLPSFAVETKVLDPRYRWYRDQFGTRCYELDALSPIVLRNRVDAAIRPHIDTAVWHQADIVEAAEHESLITVLSRWPNAISRLALNRDALGSSTVPVPRG